ncbi:sigma-70 family RNA polymerase sigma factor, partial [bacterium]|nr:sigma-70 family RNA polymerase sigma factor [candidate division CSSED10-310 bacterium]
ELLKRYERQLLNFFFRQLGDYDGAKDLMMDTFMRIYKAADRYEPRSKFSTYIYRIARNLCINEFRKREVRKADSLDLMGEETGMEPAGNELTPDEFMVRQERQIMVRRALMELSEDQRTILILSEYQGLDYEKIAQVMGCSLGTVKSRVFRARQKIREWMESHGM